MQTKIGIQLKIACFLSMLAGLMLAQLSSANVQGDLNLQPGEPQRAVVSHLDYLVDPTLSLSLQDICCDPEYREFTPLDRHQIDFGFTPARIWLRLPIMNEGDHPARWILSLNTRFMNELEAYLVIDERPVRLLADSDTRPFSMRVLPYRYLAGYLYLEPKQRAVLLIGYRSSGTTALPFSIESEASFYKKWIRDTGYNFAFYAAMLSMMLLGVFQYFILRSRIQLSYAGYVGAALLYVFHMDGLSFKYLWPDWPQWNSIASLYLGLNINIFAIAFTRSFLQTTKSRPKYDRVLLSLLFVTIGLMLLALVIGDRHIKQYSFLVTTGGILLCFGLGVTACVGGQRSALFFVAGWCSLAIAGVYASIAHLMPSTLEVSLSFDIAKICIVFDALMFSMAMADQANEIRKQRDASNRREMSLLERDLEVSRQMYLLERQYEKAMDLAQQKSLLLASAGHDLRQPIVALKMALQRIYDSGNADAATIGQFRRGFDYIDSMIKQYLEVPECAQRPLAREEPCESVTSVGQEIFPIQIILDNVAQMFVVEAENRGLQLRCVACSVMVKANPVAVMRIISNLVENAIKYTDAGSVLLGCRRRGTRLEIQVWDTGPGFSAAERESLFAPYLRGGQQAADEGYGLGLSIVAALVQDNGYILAVESTPGQGSVFRVDVPIVSPEFGTVHFQGGVA